MSLEDEVKEAFKKHEDDARAKGQRWDVVEKRVRRAHHQRLVYTSVLSLLIVAAISLVIYLGPGQSRPKGFSSPADTPTETPSSSPSSSSSSPGVIPPVATAPVPEGFKPRVGVQSAFAVDIPNDWKGGWFEGTWDFEPTGLPS